KPTDVNRLLIDVRTHFQPLTEQKRLTTQLDLCPTLPPGLANGAVLYPALLKLVENALSSTSADGVITLRTLTEENALLIEVCDTGTGINPDDLPHIFTHFFQADSDRD